MLMEINFFLNMAFNTTNHPYHLGWIFLNYLSSFVIENYPCKVQWIRGMLNKVTINTQEIIVSVCGKLITRTKKKYRKGKSFKKLQNGAVIRPVQHI